MYSDSDTPRLEAERSEASDTPRLARHYNPTVQQHYERGIHDLYRFENQHGASVIPSFLGHGRFELAHIHWTSAEQLLHEWSFWHLDDKLHCLDIDISGYLTEDEVQQELDRIAGL